MSVACEAPPANDERPFAITLACGAVTSGTTNGATLDTDESSFCGTSISIPGVWYHFLGTGNEVTFSTCSPNTEFNTKISVFEQEFLSTNINCIGGNDDACANFASEITISTTLDISYYILVHAYNSTGNFELSVDAVDCAGSSNDFCTEALPINCGETISGTTIGGTDSGESNFCIANIISPGIWYSFIGIGEEVIFSTCSSNTDYDTVISIFDGPCSNINCIGGNDDACTNNASEASVFTTLGTTYYILVHGFNDTGNFDLSVSNCPNSIIALSPKVFLQGALQNSEDGLMRDDLRINNLIPLTEPYTALSNFSHVGEGGGETINASVLAIDGDDAIVDWVLVELRDPIDPSQVLTTRSALLQRDGDVVELDGVSPVEITEIEGGDYYVAIRHRNHLGAMTVSPFMLSDQSTNIDFTTGNTWGEDAQREMGGKYALWGGNANIDELVIFQGLNNELNPIFFEVLGAPSNTLQLANYTYEGYNIGDLDMNSLAIYQGLNNEINLLFFNVLSHPDNTANLANYVIEEQLP